LQWSGVTRDDKNGRRPHQGTLDHCPSLSSFA
jgi:hypothetical protein